MLHCRMELPGGSTSMSSDMPCQTTAAEFGWTMQLPDVVPPQLAVQVRVAAAAHQCASAFLLPHLTRRLSSVQLVM